MKFYCNFRTFSNGAVALESAEVRSVIPDTEMKGIRNVKRPTQGIASEIAKQWLEAK